MTPATAGRLVACGAVSAIPSVHGQMVFAETAYREVLSGYYDALALELPRDLAVEDMAAAVDRVWPSMGVALVRGDPLGSQIFEADGQRRAVNAIDNMIPVSPCDSLIAALRAWSELRRYGGRVPAIEFCDLPVAADPARRTGTPELPDPWYVAEHGLADYLERNRCIAERARIPERDDPREAAMAAALRRHTAAGRRVLFVCGMAHWWNIADLLERGGPGASLSLQPGRRRVETFSMDASEAWLLGFCGIPAIAGSFVGSLETGGPPFELNRALSNLKQTALVEAREAEEQAISVRQVLAFEKYLGAKLALHQRFCPHLDGDLAAAASDCVHEEFSRTLKDVSLRYPFDLPDGLPQARVASAGGRNYLLTPGQAFLLPESGQTEGETRSLPARRPFPLTSEEMRKYRGMPARRYPTAEDTMQRGLMQAAWWHGERLSRSARRPPTVRVAEFEGDLGSGIDWRASMRAWAGGASADALFVKIPSRESDPDRDPVARNGAACPVAWLFLPGAKVESRASGSFGPIYSSFYWVRATAQACAGLIAQEKLAYAANILRGRIMWTEAALAALLASLEKRLKPSIEPWRDPELTSFEGPALCIAAAIRWAADRAIVVAPNDYAIPREVREYAVRRKVELLRAPWDCFPWEARRRLALQHTLPSPTFGEPDARLMEHCEAVPASLLKVRD